MGITLVFSSPTFGGLSIPVPQSEISRWNVTEEGLLNIAVSELAERIEATEIPALINLVRNTKFGIHGYIPDRADMIHECVVYICDHCDNH